MGAADHGQRKHLVRQFLEDDAQFGIEGAGLQTQWQRTGQVGLQAGEVETVEIDVEFAL